MKVLTRGWVVVITNHVTDLYILQTASINYQYFCCSLVAMPCQWQYHSICLPEYLFLKKHRIWVLRGLLVCFARQHFFVAHSPQVLKLAEPKLIVTVDPLVSLVTAAQKELGEPNVMYISISRKSKA